MSKYVLNFHQAAKAVVEIQNESKRGKDFTVVAFEQPYVMEGHECVSIVASWKEGTRHYSRQLHLKDDGTQDKIMRLFQGNASAEPLHKPGEDVNPFSPKGRRHESFTVDL